MKKLGEKSTETEASKAQRGRKLAKDRTNAANAHRIPELTRLVYEALPSWKHALGENFVKEGIAEIIVDKDSDLNSLARKVAYRIIVRANKLIMESSDEFKKR